MIDIIVDEGFFGVLEFDPSVGFLLSSRVAVVNEVPVVLLTSMLELSTRINISVTVSKNNNETRILFTRACLCRCRSSSNNISFVLTRVLMFYHRVLEHPY